MIAPYVATGAGQLSLETGNLINVRQKSPRGWWEGELQVELFLGIFVLCIVSTHHDNDNTLSAEFVCAWLSSFSLCICLLFVICLSGAGQKKM